jgi:hypothetical protein
MEHTPKKRYTATDCRLGHVRIMFLWGKIIAGLYRTGQNKRHEQRSLTA